MSREQVVSDGGDRGESGAVITEFALVFVLYVGIVMISIQAAIWAFTISATQFAVWEGCRRGAAAYQPAPPDGTTPGGLVSQLDIGSSEDAAGASFAALDRIEEILNWLPLTEDYYDLTAAVVEEEVLPGEEGQRDITASVRVNAVVLLPIKREWLSTESGGVFVVERACRLRLARYYAY